MSATSDNGKISNVVLNALLESFYDILDKDGEISILRHAGFPELAQKRLNPGEMSSLEIFNQLINAMNDLLCFSTVILNEIGRKFTVYSDPCGSGIDGLIRNLKSWIDVPWDIAIRERDDTKIVIEVENCPFCQNCTEPNGENCQLLCGMFARAVAETSDTPDQVKCSNSGHIFTIKLKD